MSNRTETTCRRVVGRNDKLTGYAGGLGRKRQLLDLERANRPASEDGDGTDLTGPLAAAFTW